MPATEKNRLALADAYRDYLLTASRISQVALDGLDAPQTADEMAEFAQSLSLASQHFYEALSLQVCRVFNIDPDEEVTHFYFGVTGKPNAPSDNPMDFADWIKVIAAERAVAPIVPLMAAE